jgi:hypothetical protein
VSGRVGDRPAALVRCGCGVATTPDARQLPAYRAPDAWRPRGSRS